jgi:hypothetical protein
MQKCEVDSRIENFVFTERLNFVFHILKTRVDSREHVYVLHFEAYSFYSIHYAYFWKPA